MNQVNVYVYTNLESDTCVQFFIFKIKKNGSLFIELK